VSEPLRLPLSNLSEGERELDQSASRYLVRVHRLRADAAFVVFDPETATEADAWLTRADPRSAACRVGPPRSAACVAPLPVVLVQALGKGDKPDEVVRDATALGARGIVFVASARSVPRLGARAEGRGARWRSLALDAARQSGRGDVPFVLAPASLDAALAEAEVERASLRVVLAPGAPQSLYELCADWDGRAPLALLIGPEGGLSPEEITASQARGFVPARLAALVLRTETAATAALGALGALAESRRPR
jgi:16S rRNA (uracil1498-N3)-methyltransferase